MPSELVGEHLASWPSQLGSFSASGYVAYAGIYRSINKLLYDKIPDTDVRKEWWLNEEKKSSYLDGLQWKDVAKDTIYNGQDIAGANLRLPNVHRNWLRQVQTYRLKLLVWVVGKA